MSATETTETSTTETEAYVASYVSRYAAAKGDRKAQAAIRTELTKALQDAIRSLDLPAAASAQSALDALVAAKPETETVPVEVSLAARIHDLESAAWALRSGDVVPDGLEVPTGGIDYDAVERALNELEGLTDAATKIASAKITKTRSGERNSIGDVLDRAFDSQPVGTILKISDVVAEGSVEGYRPSGGAVRATFDKSGRKVTESHEFTLMPSDNQGNVWRVRLDS